MNNNWIEFWNQKHDGFDTIMSNTTAYFNKKFFKKFPITKEDVILDYGCGPGYFLEKCLAYKNTFIGLDISHHYIQLCKNKFEKHPNFKFYQIKNATNFTGLEKFIEEEKVTKIVCLSVLQYFTDEKTVSLFLNSIFKSGQTTVIFGDVLPKKNSIYKDAFYVFFAALKNGFLLNYLSFIINTLFSDYFKKDKTPLLCLDKEFFKNYAKNHHLDVSFYKLTIPKTRYTVVLSHKNPEKQPL